MNTVTATLSPERSVTFSGSKESPQITFEPPAPVPTVHDRRSSVPWAWMTGDEHYRFKMAQGQWMATNGFDAVQVAQATTAAHTQRSPSGRDAWTAD